jgi:D-alanyl-D-alanine dipeptidase
MHVAALGAALLLIVSSGGEPTAPASDTGLVDAALAIPTLHLDMRYAQSHNLAGRPLYHSARCLLRPEVIAALRKAQVALEAEGLSLLMWDCYRPARVQQDLWRVTPVPGLVANPKRGSNHTRGAAVDVSLCTPSGKPLPMPTDFDDLGPKAALTATEGISPEAQRNRNRLVAAMKGAGFHTIRKEWWHFDAPGALDLPLLQAEP